MSNNTFIAGMPNIMVVDSNGRRFIVHSIKEAEQFNAKVKEATIETAPKKEPVEEFKPRRKKALEF